MEPRLLTENDARAELSRAFEALGFENGPLRRRLVEVVVALTSPLEAYDWGRQIIDKLEEPCKKCSQ